MNTWGIVFMVFIMAITILPGIYAETYRIRKGPKWTTIRIKATSK